MHPLHGVLAGVTIVAQDLESFVGDIDYSLACNRLAIESSAESQLWLFLAIQPASHTIKQAASI